ncbi:MAG: 50S ribosomal protein L11 methyltransferase [Synergistaceae bacterium]|nr:50S ribosomal protein L11 methyltransferase [Synergistaceae bacterium]
MNNDNNSGWWTVELSVPVSRENRQLNEEKLSTIAAITESIGSEITTEKDFTGQSRLFLKTNYTAHRGLDDIVHQLEFILKEPDFKGIEISRCSKTANQAWDTQHYDAFPPLAVGKTLMVMAPWHEKEEIPANRTPIYIFPASAFGTGYHESTQIALSLLEGAVKNGDTILDIGTGTGILFIAALKLGAGKAIARDIDPATLTEARRNMHLNGINFNLCELTEGDLLKGFSGQVNILTANILLNPNLTMLPDVKRVLKPKGFAIFSGMTHIESYTFISVLNSSGLMIEREMKIGDWWGCRAIKAWG